MNKDDIKMKYLIGTFRDEPNYPSREDFEYLIKNWYFHEGGHHFIHTYRGIPEIEGKPIFPDNILVEKLNGDEKATKSLLSSLIDNKIIEEHKSTKFTKYYIFI